MRGQLVAILVAAMLMVFGGCTDAADSRVSVKELRCEYRINPAGIDVVKPRLNWILESSQRGQMQSAYQVLVAGSEEKLKKDQGDLWDTGKVNSDESIQVAYAGKKLKSRMRCCWKVRVWDKDGRVSAWSEPASWTMGLLESKDWQAKWIGYDKPQVTSVDEPLDLLSLEGCKWVWFPEGEPQKSAPAGTRFFRRRIEVPSGKNIKLARFRLVVDNEGTLFVNGQEVQKFSGWKPPYTFDITERLKAGTNTLAITATNKGDAANPAGLGGKMVIEFEAGDWANIRIDHFWKASDTEQEDWEKPDFDDGAWTNAKELVAVGEGPWGKVHKGRLVLPPPPYLRKAFSVDRAIKRAVVYASALGLYELHINGERVGKDYFTPGWTDYTKRVYYQTYDVTNLLAIGGNAIGAILADGWYAGYLGFGRKREHYGDKPRLFVQLEIEYADGSRQMVVTDKSWKAGYGPHLEADFLMGETYDGRKEIDGWDTAGFGDSAWDAVALTDKVEGKVQSYPGVTVQEMQQIKPVKRTEPKKGAYVFDMGQNFAGWVRLKVKGKAGTKVVLRFAEMLNPDGTIYTKNLREARCTDTYILAGKGEEIWQPSFTFHGFRYVEVTGYPGKPSPDAIIGIVVHSDTPAVGFFECSNPMVNQLWRNIVWSQRGNFIEVPTDCPQRDERLGWTGDAQIFARTATYNMDVAAFFTKWLVDLEDAQTKEGAFPDVAPHKVAMGSGVAAWGDAGVICPWAIYQVYGDRRVIERHYESMQKWIAYLQKNSKNLLRPAHGYGDWVSIGSNTPKDVIATAYFAYSTRLLSKMAAAIGKSEDAKKYETLFQQIKNAFNKAYVFDDARIKGETQTCYLLGLYFDLLPKDKCEPAAKHLVADLKKRDWHLSTGFVGLSYLLPTLTQMGHLDIAYRLLNNETFPSWGYSIKNGATTIWERWDGWTEEKGFQDPGMNSFNHYAFGSVGRWLFGVIAGIDTDGPGYKRIIIRPQPGGGFSYAKASYKSIHGKIASDWKIKGRTFTLNVTVPANTTATVYVPAKDAESITEGGKPAARSKGVRFLRMEAGAAVYEVGSGNYAFVSEAYEPRGSYSYERALRVAEEAKAKIELDDKPWPDQYHLALGRVDLKGDGQKSRLKVRAGYSADGWATEKWLTLLSPDKPEPVKLYMFWDGLSMYYPPGVEWSANAGDPDYAEEREFLEKIKYAYGYISEEDILARSDDPNFAIHLWGKDNGRIQEGRITIRKYKGRPKYFSKAKPRLEEGPMIYTSYRSGVAAYDSEADEYFLIFYPDSGWFSPSVFAKVDSWLMIGTWLGDLVAVDLQDYYLKRFESSKGAIGKIEVTDSKIIVDDGRYELERPILRTGEKIRNYRFIVTSLK